MIHPILIFKTKTADKLCNIVNGGLILKKHAMVFLLLSFIFGGAGLETPYAESSQNTAPNRELVLAGSGSCLPIISKLAELYNLKSPTQIKVPPSIGTRGAVAAVIQGSLKVGLTSRPLKEDEKKAGLSEIKFATIGIVFGVHTGVPKNNITGPELVDIFNGKQNLWQNGKTIIVLNREEGDSSIGILAKKIAGFEAAYHDSIREKRWVVLFTDKEAHEAIAKTENSFGFCDTTIIMVPLPIKMLRFNQIEPTLENINNGKYPFSKGLFFIFKGKSIPREACDFVSFVKSPQGAKILMDSGALPVKD